MRISLHKHPITSCFQENRLFTTRMLMLVCMLCLSLISQAQRNRRAAREEDDPDMPAFTQTSMSKEEFMLKRAEAIAMKRGVDSLHPFDPAQRAAAVRQMLAQRSAMRGGTPLSASWTEIGPNPIPNGQVLSGSQLPVSGRVTCIAVHPTNPNIVYVGTAQGGLYRTLDGGTTWTAMMDNAQSLAIGSVAISPSSPDIVYVGTGEPNFSADCFFGVGVYRIDNASTASPTLTGPLGNTNFAGRAIGKIIVHPTDPATIFVASTSGVGGILNAATSPLPNRGVWRCTNATSASPVFTQIGVLASPNNNFSVRDIAIDPLDPNIMVANLVVGNGGLYRTVNALAATPTWTQVFTFPSGSGGTSNLTAEFASVHPAGDASATFYAAVGNNASGTGAGRILKSTDGGATFTQINGLTFCSPQCFYNIAVDVDPTDKNKVYVGGTGSSTFVYSTDGGTTFAPSQANLHTDTHTIGVAPSSPTTIYFGSDGGIYKSTNSGITWTSLNNSTFKATQFMSVAVHPTDPNFTIGGTQDNGTEYMNSGGTWTRADFGDGGYSVIDQSSTGTANVNMYHTYFNASNLTGYAYVGVTANATEGNWAFRGCAGSTANGITCTGTINFYAPLERGPGTPNSIYYGADRLYRSVDFGANNATVSQVFASPISAIGIAPQNDNVRIIGRNDGGLFGTTTGSTTLTDLDAGGAVPNSPVARTVIDPNNVNTAYVTLSAFNLSGSVWKTTNLNNASPTWTNIGASLPKIPVNALVVDPLNSNVVFIGTDIGVYASTDAGATWSPYGTGLPVVAVFGMALTSYNKLRVATHGRGMWEIQNTLSCPTITVTNPGVTTGTTGTAFNQTFTSSGGVPTVTYSTSSTLPAGLTLSSGGVLSGTPTQTGSFPITVTATDANACTGTGSTYTLVISCPTITVTNPAVTTGSTGTAFSQTFTSNGGTPAVTYSTASTLPSGLTLSSGGVLSGTPTQSGSFPITVTATDANSCTGTSSVYTLVISCPAITVTNPVTTTGVINIPFSQTFTQSGASGSATFTTASTLPSGLTLSTAGVLSGTPAATGTFPITVTVTDGNGCTGTSSLYTLVISCSAFGMDPVSNQIVCNGASTAAITFSSSTPGVTYNWVNDNTSVGLAASGTGNIAAFTATNPGTTPQVATITVTPQTTAGPIVPPAGWTQAQEYTVTDHSGSTVTDYQLRMVVNTQALVTAGNMLSSGDDIRFGYNSGATLYSYWIESGMNTASTVIWVKIDNIPANGNKVFYMYYGNPAASAVSTVNGTFYGPNSATDSVNTGGAGGVGNSQRGFRFAPNEDILVASFGKDEPTGTTRYVTLFDNATQAILAQQQISGPAGQYSYSNLPSPLWLTTGTQYILELYQGASDGYYFGSSSQIGQHLTYFDMKYCNGCTENTFPTNTLNNFHYGYPDFWYYTKNNITPAPTYLQSSSICTGTPQTFTITVNPTPDVVATPASQTACSGSAITTVALSSAVSGTTYSWTRDNTGTVTGIAASGSGNISGTLTNTTAAPVTVTFTITPSANGCTGTPVTATVTVNPAPNVTATPAAQTVCNNTSTTAISFTGTVAGTVYNWVNNTTSIGLAASGSGNIPSFTATNGGTAPVTATITVTPQYTSGGPVAQTFNYTGAVQTFTVPAGVTSITIDAYGAQGGSGATGGNASAGGNGGLGSKATGTLAVTPGQVLNIYVGGAGATGTGGYNGGANGGTQNAGGGGGASDVRYPGNTTADRIIVGAGGGGGGRGGCEPGTVAGGNGGNGDGNGANGVDSPDGGAGAGAVGSGAGVKGVGCAGFLGADGFVGTAAGSGGDGGAGQACCCFSAGSIPGGGGGGGGYLGGGGGGGGSAGTTACSGNNKGGGGGGAGGSSFTGTLTAPAIAAGTNTGNGKVVITYSTAITTCTGTPQTVTITVNPTPNAVATPSSQTICSANAITTIALTSAVSGTTYTWTRDNTGSVTGIAASGSGNISGTLTNTTTAPVTVTFTITPSANGCTGSPITATVLVNPTPNAVATPASQTICSASAITTIVLSGSVSGTTYNWTRDNTGSVTGIAASGSGNISGTLTNTTSAPVTVTFTITPVANGCNGTPVTATVLVNPTPVAVATPSAQTACSGIAITPIVLSSAVSGTTYSWTRNNTATVTGIAASGTGNISGTLTNTTTSPVTVTFTITPSANGCTGAAITATVTVNPTPVITISPTAQTICQGTVVPITVTSGVPGVNGNQLVSSGTISVAVPDNNAAGTTATLTVPALPAGAVVTGVDVTINMTHTWDGDMVFNLKAPNNQVINLINSRGGSGDNFVNTVISSASATSLGTGSAPFTGTFAADANAANPPTAYPQTTAAFSGLYSVPAGVWTLAMRDQAGGDLGTLTSWSVNINYTIPPPAVWSPVTGLYTNAAGTTPYVAGTPLTTVYASPLTTTTYSAVATVNGCASAPVTSTITVNPIPDAVATPAAQTVCTGTAITTIAFTGSVPGTTYNWTRDNTATVTGIAASGSGNISGTLTNPGLNPVTVTFTITPTANGCVGTPITATVTVNPLPTITCPGNITQTAVGSCSVAVNYTPTVTGTPAPALSYSFSGATTGSGTGSGSGSQFRVGVTTVTVTATNVCSTVSCSFTVTILDGQIPAITAQPVNSTVCAGGSATFSVTSTNVVGYQWQSWNGSAWVNIPGANASTYTLTGITSSLNATSYRVVVIGLCTNTNSNPATLYVNPLPSISLSTTVAQLQPGQSAVLTATANPPGGNYAWFFNSNPLAASGATYGPVDVNGLGSYRVRYTDLNGCVSTSNDVVISGLISAGVWVYPNPNTGIFQVRFYNQPNEKITVIVFASNGQKVYQRAITTGSTPYTQVDVDIHGKPAGVYEVMLVDGSGKIRGTKRIIVNLP